VGCSDGKLYTISQTGVIVSLAVGDGVAAKAFGGIVDAPLVEWRETVSYTRQWSAGNGANGVLVQAKADLSSSLPCRSVPATNATFTYQPPNNAYFTSPTAAGAMMYVAGTTGWWSVLARRRVPLPAL